MTASPDSSPQVFADLHDALRSLRAAGLRLSTARRLVLEALFSADGPVSAAYLSRTLSLDESSVYRNLELLEQRGVVRHLHLGHSPGLYALATEEEVEYLYCERCTKVTVLSPERLDNIRKQIRAEFGHTPRFTHFAIVGICENCATTDQNKRGSSAGTSPSTGRAEDRHMHSHGDYVHSHPGRAHHTH
jgi:Fur family transcriptional regulator, ferric uptake regulator